MNAIMELWGKLGKRGKVVVIFGCVIATLVILDFLRGG